MNMMIRDLFSKERSQLRRHVDSMLFPCWSSVKDGGPTLNQQWVGFLLFAGAFKVNLVSNIDS